MKQIEWEGKRNLKQNINIKRQNEWTNKQKL